MRKPQANTHPRRAAVGHVAVVLISTLVGACSRSPGATTSAPDASAPAFSVTATAASTQSATAIRDATIPVDGMSCGSCVARLKRGLKPIDGVVEVHVSLEQRNAVIRYDEGKVSADRLVAAINDLGYTAGVPVVTPVKGGGS